jgi:hypothetical protein
MCHNRSPEDIKQHVVGYAWVTDIGTRTGATQENELAFQGVLRCVKLAMIANGVPAKKARYPKAFKVVRNARGDILKNLMEVNTEPFYYWWEYTARIAPDGLFLPCDCEDCLEVSISLFFSYPTYALLYHSTSTEAEYVVSFVS